MAGSRKVKPEKKAAATTGGLRAAAREERGRPAKRTRAASEAGESCPEFGTEGKLYHRIGEVSRITGVKPYVLRYWEGEFRCMSPQKSRSKQRLYRAKDIETILVIKKLLYEERYTIAGARQKVRELIAAGAVQDWLRERAGQRESGASRSDGGALEGAGREDRPGHDLLREIRQELESIRSALTT